MRHALLAAYDAQLRAAAEVADMPDVRRDGPLWIGRPSPERGFVTFRDLSTVPAEALAALLDRTVAGFADDPEVVEFEWKARLHDRVDLDAQLRARGLLPGERETVMAGLATGLAGDDPPPAGVTVRTATTDDVDPVVVMQSAAFGRDIPGMVEATQRLLASPDVELWLAEADGEVIGSGRLDRVPGTDFAGLWGGAVAEKWRGRGVYRCLTQARARAAVAAGITFLYADCTVMSRVILEACGLLPITTTVPYLWRRDRQSR